MKASKITVLIILVFAFQLVAAMTLEPVKGKTHFIAVGRPSALKINGTGHGPAGDLKLEKIGDSYVLNGEALMDLSSLDTGIEMRDRHMKEKYLEVEKFKQAKLVFKDVKLPSDKVSKGGEVEVNATLDLHGQQKPMPVSMVLEVKNGLVKTIAKFKVKLSEFNISIPTFSGITVADEVNITTETEVKL